MSDLVVCCDGTWQDATQRSNVIQLWERLDPAIRPRYLEGVGTGGIVDRIRGGITGWGIDKDLRTGYRYLVDGYGPGARISVFGFSRGAYLARSLAGMVGTVGIVDRTGLDEEQLDAAVKAVYEQYQAHKVEVAAGRRSSRDTGPPPPATVPLAYDPRSPEIPVALVGVWDTVGALGIPSYIGLPDVLGSRERYEFLDVVLDPRIPYARHAVSLDEMRGPFRPTLWDETATVAGQDMRQVWFPGDHCDVGGGHDVTGLSDGALEWMIDQARDTIGLPFTGTPTVPDPVGGTLHGMRTDALGAAEEAVMQPRPRATPRIDAEQPLPDRVDGSAYARQKADPRPDRPPYHPTRTLDVGDAAEVLVAADRSWNDTDLYLQPGTYRFTATGEWTTPFGGGGPGGASRWPVLGTVFTRLVDLAEQGLRRVTHNPEAELVGARREADAPLMALVGLVANEVTDTDGQIVVEQSGERLADEKFVIGDSVQQTIERAGYLWAYGNDAWGSYGNNSGRIQLTVRRL